MLLEEMKAFNSIAFRVYTWTFGLQYMDIWFAIFSLYMDIWFAYVDLIN